MVTSLPMRASGAGSGNKNFYLKTIPPEPQNIGRAKSHGCVRLTNRDIARLAEMASAETQVVGEA